MNDPDPARYLPSTASVVKLTVAVPIARALIVLLSESSSIMELSVVVNVYFSEEGVILGKETVSPIVTSVVSGLILNGGSIGSVEFS